MAARRRAVVDLHLPESLDEEWLILRIDAVRLAAQDHGRRVPKVIEASVVAERAGRENGAASPMVRAGAAPADPPSRCGDIRARPVAPARR